MEVRWAIGILVAGLVLGAPSHPGLPFPTGHPAPSEVPRPVDVGAATSASSRPDTLCAGTLPRGGIPGQVTVEGGALPATFLGGLLLNYTYSVQWEMFSGQNGSLLGEGCYVYNGSVTTASNGSFRIPTLERPANCTNIDNVTTTCTVYSLPNIPLNVSWDRPVPAGYQVVIYNGYTHVGVHLLYELSNVSVEPAGPTVTTSVGAPLSFTASAWTVNGSSSPLSPTYAWSVNGTGWSFLGAAAGPTVHVQAGPGAGVATLSVQATATVNGTALEPVRTSVGLVAVPTEVETGQMNRTTLDAGGSVSVRLTALGASGFPYSAFVEPGLGLPAVPAPCTTGPPDSGLVDVACAVNVTFPAPGTAQPSANLTNGYSSSTWRFPDVVVTAPPRLEVASAAVAGYVGAPIQVDLLAASGSGAPPYSRACLQAGPLPVVCDASAGPTWAFSPTFAATGVFSAIAWAVDADGTNASFAFPIEVVPPLELGAVTATSNATVGAPLALSGSVSGGFAPLRFWWNVSGEVGSLWEGATTSDGTLNATAVPTAVGPMLVTLTVMDGLATVVASDLLVDVGPATAVRVAAATPPPSAPVTVGDPLTLSWEAFDLSGVSDPTFQAPARLVLATGAGPPVAWANATGVGPLAALGGGGYAVPATAWVDGVLTVALTVGTATSLQVDLAGGGLPGPVPPMNLTVLPDLTHVRLFAPTVERGGARANATLWRAEDLYGNPVPGALLTVELAFAGARDDMVVAAVALAGGGTGVWVNFSALSPSSGEVTVVDGAGAVVLGPILVPAATGPALPVPAVATLATLLPIGATGFAMLVVVRRRRHARTAVVDDELRRLAEGRAQVVALIEQAGESDLAGLEGAWTPPPAPPSLAEWVASLVADGTLRATVGEDGRPRFCLAAQPAGPPRVTVDPEELDRSLRQREAATRSDEGSDGPA